VGVNTFHIKSICRRPVGGSHMWQKRLNGNNDKIHRDNILGIAVNFRGIIMSQILKSSEG
jgi:hypothetical protein